jgi:hypothetical protein
MANQPPIPSTWPELIARDERRMEGIAEAMEERLEEDLPDAPPDLRPVHLASAGNQLTLVAAVAGPSRVVAWLPRLAPYYAEALRTFDTDKRTPTGAVATLSYRHVWSCVEPLPRDLPDPEPAWLPKMVPLKAQLDENEQYRLAFAAVASGQPELAPKLLGGTPLPAAPKPGETFGMAVGPFIRYLGAASREELSAADVEPAWRSFLGGFPFQLAAGILDWTLLLYAARVVHARIGGAPVETTAGWLHDEVRRQR